MRCRLQVEKRQLDVNLGVRSAHLYALFPRSYSLQALFWGGWVRLGLIEAV